ncbi:MAG: DUF262 domain-containing protein [Acidimicrobiaceae bacterium]|nr:DUF262 domain-containing protein [Acidimicrobiaceae bacterium]
MSQGQMIFPEDVEAAEDQIVEQSKRIEFYVTEYSIELLSIKMHNGDFVIPPYQREFTWEEDRKSRFVESVVMGLPIPFLFFWERPEDGKLEVVDGSQRLRTLHEFVEGKFRLGELDVLGRLSGFSFTELPESRQRKIKNRSIRGIVLNEHADEQARFDMFERINTGSKAANTAEVRRGALAGPFMKLVIELAQDERFVKLAPVPEKQELERGREELVTRFFAYGDGLGEYRDRPAYFLFDYSKKANERFSNDQQLTEQYRERFRATMSFVETHFPYGFPKKAGSTTTPRARFEAIAIGTHLALTAKPELAAGAAPPPVEDWLEGDEFVRVTGSDGANAIARLQGRIGFVRDKLIG